MLLGVVMTSLDNTVVNVALPSISRRLHIGIGGAAWVVDAYLLSFATLLLTGGRLADTFGRRRVFVAGALLFTVASLRPRWPAPPCCHAAGRFGAGLRC